MEETNAEKIESEEGRELWPGFVAGVVRPLAIKSALLGVAALKGLAKWLFKYPIKFFRPAAVNPWLVMRTIAEQEGRKLNMTFVKETIQTEGFGLLGKNVLPLLFANAAVGAVLFNTFSTTYERLAGPDESEYRPQHPFIAGFAAGVSQSFLATPLENIQRYVDMNELSSQRRQTSLVKHALENLKAQFPTDANPVAWTRAVLLRGLPHIIVKESIGFSLFFGVYENVRRGLRGAVDTWMATTIPDSNIAAPSKPGLTPATDANGWLRGLPKGFWNGCATVVAGCAGGAGYNLVTYPLTQMASVTASDHPGAGEIIGIVRKYGVRPFYTGVGAQLVRAAPPSAIALLVYEIATHGEA
ncbi:mitochondrial carrier domain-containing protein [Cladochytrium replicatum]|nr:mitochondrial carrier domain-containing protein [Cladochytrium replicatum]